MRGSPVKTPANLALLGVSLSLVLAAFAIHDVIPEAPKSPQHLDPPDPYILNIFTLGHRTMAADLAWLDALQYFGDVQNAKYSYSRLDGILDAVVALDPDFRYAYLFGGLALSSTLGGVEAADELLARGMVRFPDEWRFPFYIGVNAFFYLEDPSRAAEYIGAAAKLSGAPVYLAQLAVKLHSSARECDRSLQLIDELQRGSDDPLMLQRLEERRLHTIWECNFQLLEAAVAGYQANHGAAPSDLDTLIRAGVLPGLPPDPYGGQWGISSDGAVTSTTKRKRLRVSLPKGMQEQFK